MKELKDVLEGLLRGMDNTLAAGEDDLRATMNVPSIKDFRGISGNRFIRIIEWICPEVFEKYRGRISTTRDMAGLQIRLYKDARPYEGDPYIFEFSVIDKRGWSSWHLPAWKTYLHESERDAEKIVMQVIERLAYEPGLLDKFFDQCDRYYKAVKPSEKVKNPLTDL